MGGRAPSFVALVGMVAATLAGCGTRASDPGPTSHGHGFDPGEVTPVVLRLADGPVELAPWTYCLGNGCADGAPPADPHRVAGATEVPFTFDRPDWSFDATFREHGRECARMITVPVEKTGEREFRITPAGLAGDWDVDVSGRGDSGGDVITTFRWRTPVEGRMPERAGGSAAVLADHDGALDSYGFELSLTNLAERPRRAEAVITVAGADGRTTVIRPHWQRACYSTGDLWFSARRARVWPPPGSAAARSPTPSTSTSTASGTSAPAPGRWARPRTSHRTCR